MGENRTRQEQTESEQQQEEEYLFSKLAYKIKANKKIKYFPVVVVCTL